MAGGAGAVDSIYDSPLFNFEGFYAGIQGGAGLVPGPGFVGTASAVAGVNFALSDALLAGIEFQGGADFNGTGLTGADALGMVHLGTYLTEQLMAYGTVGGGLVNSVGSYAFGAGLEYPVTNQFSVRGEVLGTGTWGVLPDGVRGNAGVLFHLN
jgi:outer membrane immunogenic protein